MARHDLDPRVIPVNSVVAVRGTHEMGADGRETRDSLSNVLARWHECFLLDEDPTPEDLGVTDVDLKEAVRARIEDQKRLYAFLGLPAVARADEGCESSSRDRVHFPAAESSDAALALFGKSDVDQIELPGYSIESVLGSGGMGIVYLANEVALERKVAIKVLRDRFGDDPRARDRFQREAAAVAKCQHPNLVQIFQVGEHENDPYLVLEYVEGDTLAKFLDGEPKPPHAAAVMVEKLARAIAHAHGRGVVHRDLKPSNVLVDRDGEPRISDFGLARLDDRSTRTEEGCLPGTPAYMAPEQVSSKYGEVGPPADIHALGVILYEALTGRIPYRADTLEGTLSRILCDQAEPPSKHEPGIPRDLEAICLKCLEKRPNHRYMAAVELAEDLRRFLDGRPTLARPLTPWVRGWRWCARNPWVALASTALAATVFVSVSAFVVQTHRHNVQLQTEIERTAAKAKDARRNYQEARSTIQAMLERLNDRRFEGTPRIKELERDQMDDASAFYDRVLREASANDDGVMVDTARAVGLLSTMQFMAGRIDRAEELVRQALGLLEKLRSEHPENLEYLRMQVECLNRRCVYLHRLGRMNDSLAVGQKSIQLAEVLARSSPDDLPRQEIVAYSHDTLAATLRDAGRLQEASDHYGEAVKIRQRLGPAKTPHLAQRHAETLMNDGVTHWNLNQFTQAESRFREAERLFATIPAEILGHVSLGNLYLNWSGLLYTVRRFDEAINRAESGLKVLDRDVKLEPNDTIVVETCLKLHGNRALALGAAGRHGEAAREWTRVIELSSTPVPPDCRLNLAIELIKSGETDRASRQIGLVNRTELVGGLDRYNLGAYFALAADAARKDPKPNSEQRTRLVGANIADALKWMNLASETGLFRDAGMRERIKNDDDVAILKDNPEFRRLTESPKK